MRLTLVLCLLSGPTWADACHDWWFTRNLIIDRAGYCFGSVLGQAQFDNTGCIGKDVTLDAASTQAVNDIRALEAEYQCRVDTGQQVLNLPDRDLRLRLAALPIADGLESACITYRAAPLALRSGPWPDAPVIGQITAGLSISYAHLPAGNWAYVTTYTRDTAFVSGGWLSAVIGENDCEFWAG